MTSPEPRQPPDPHASNAEKVRWATVVLLEQYDYLNTLTLRERPPGIAPRVSDAICQANAVLFDVASKLEDPPPIPMLIWCPMCGARHIDGESIAPHALHVCQNCGLAWRHAIERTVGVHFLPGFKDPNAEPPLPERWKRDLHDVVGDFLAHRR